MLQSNVSNMRLMGYKPTTTAAPAAPAAVAAPAAAPLAQTASVPSNASRLMTQWSKATQDNLEVIRQEAIQLMTTFRLPAAIPAPVAQTLSSIQDRIKALLQPAAPQAPQAPEAPKAPAAPAAPAAAPAAKPKAQAKPAKPKKPKAPTSAASFKEMLGISDAKLGKILDIPADSARKNLPQIAKALQESGIRTKNGIIAALATIKTEVGSFQPINEYGGPSYWAKYNGRSDLGNRPGTNDGVTYHGRGYIQLTGRANYGTYGEKVGENLVKNPERALNPKVAAEVLAEYFKARSIPEMANKNDWRGVRRAVNGGYNGWDRFISTVNKLKSALK